jgi:hypothetical protein
MNYYFRIKNIYCYPTYQNLENVVFTIIWDYVDDVYSFSIPGSTDIPFNSENSYTPYESLTESQVLSWVEQYTSTAIIEDAQTQIAFRIEEANKAPEVINPTLPWT